MSSTLQDIRGSIGYAKALSKVGIITEAECKSLVDGLGLVGKEWLAQSFVIKEGDEDIHTANERRLGELIGAYTLCCRNTSPHPQRPIPARRRCGSRNAAPGIR